MDLNATLLGQAITFFILVVFTWKFVWPPLMKALDEREQKIKQGLVSAEQGESLLKDAQIRADKLEKDARVKAKSILDEAEKNAVAHVDAQKQVAQVEAKKIIDDAQAQIEKMTSQIKDELRKEFAGLVALSVSEILAREVNVANHDDLIQRITKH
jgi:F-type H+-transporting ATPase subunit b